MNLIGQNLMRLGVKTIKSSLQFCSQHRMALSIGGVALGLYILTLYSRKSGRDAQPKLSTQEEQLVQFNPVPSSPPTTPPSTPFSVETAEEWFTYAKEGRDYNYGRVAELLDAAENADSNALELIGTRFGQSMMACLIGSEPLYRNNNHHLPRIQTVLKSVMGTEQYNQEIFFKGCLWKLRPKSHGGFDSGLSEENWAAVHDHLNQYGTQNHKEWASFVRGKSTIQVKT